MQFLFYLLLAHLPSRLLKDLNEQTQESCWLISSDMALWLVLYGSIGAFTGLVLAIWWNIAVNVIMPGAEADQPSMG